MILRRALLLFALAGGMAAYDASACSCTDPGPPCRALPQADAAFVGKVLQIEGRIDELTRDPASRETRLVGPMRGVTVFAEHQGDGRRWEAKTDGQGWFRIWGLTFGRYRVRAVLPDTFAPEATTRDDVTVERGVCGWVHMLATPVP